jgi:hypothetical protein
LWAAALAVRGPDARSRSGGYPWQLGRSPVGAPSSVCVGSALRACVRACEVVLWGGRLAVRGPDARSRSGGYPWQLGRSPVGAPSSVCVGSALRACVRACEVVLWGRQLVRRYARVRARVRLCCGGGRSGTGAPRDERQPGVPGSPLTPSDDLEAARPLGSRAVPPRRLPSPRGCCVQAQPGSFPRGEADTRSTSGLASPEWARVLTGDTPASTHRRG